MKKPDSSQWHLLKGNGHELKCRKFHSNAIKIILQGWSESGTDFAQSLCSLCISVLGATQNPAGCDP